MRFNWAVDTASRGESETASNLGATPPDSFASEVDGAIRSSSDTEADLGTSLVHGFDSEVDGAIRSSSGTEADLGTSPVHGFASAVDMRTVAARVFTLAELKAATNNFSRDNIIGAGSHTVVYRGKLVDGREVVIKRGETSTWRRSATKSELASFSNLHNHNNLVWLVGFFCEERYEMLLVYEYMKNGSLYDCLHDSSVLNSWKMRIKIALDASRGIQYLHNYADPSIVHGHIKSSNILLDATWTARVSDVELTFMKKRAGTVGYIDPDLNVLTAKSDVNGLGIVLLELLTGKTPIFEYRKDGEDGGWKHVVDFAVPAIMAGELVKILDPGLYHQM